jgi:hypothetical protein
VARVMIVSLCWLSRTHYKEVIKRIPKWPQLEEEVENWITTEKIEFL